MRFRRLALAAIAIGPCLPAPTLAQGSPVPSPYLSTDVTLTTPTGALHGTLLAFAGFTAVFAADVLTEDRPFGWLVVALAMHLVPTALVLVVAVVAWDHEGLGAAAAAFLALLYMLTKGAALPWTDALVIAGPLAIVAILYGVNAVRHRHAGAPGRA